MTSDASYPDTRLLIDNQCETSRRQDAPTVVNPATGERIGRVAHASTADLDLALAAAQRGFDAMGVGCGERARRDDAHGRGPGPPARRHDRTLLTRSRASRSPKRSARSGRCRYHRVVRREGRRVYGRIVPARNLAVEQRVLKEPGRTGGGVHAWNSRSTRSCAARRCAGTGCSFLVKAPEETPAAPAALLAAFVARVCRGNRGRCSAIRPRSRATLIPHRRSAR